MWLSLTNRLTITFKHFSLYCTITKDKIFWIWLVIHFTMPALLRSQLLFVLISAGQNNRERTPWCISRSLIRQERQHDFTWCNPSFINLLAIHSIGQLIITGCISSCLLAVSWSNILSLIGCYNLTKTHSKLNSITSID